LFISLLRIAIKKTHMTVTVQYRLIYEAEPIPQYVLIANGQPIAGSSDFDHLLAVFCAELDHLEGDFVSLDATYVTSRP
jgi:hypothetical protein